MWRTEKSGQYYLQIFLFPGSPKNKNYRHTGVRLIYSAERAGLQPAAVRLD